MSQSFIELPRLAFDGREVASLYVNTVDIISLYAEYDGQTRLEVRCLGSEGMSVAVKTYVPLLSILDVLGELASHPGVRSWSDDSKVGWSAPIAHALRAAAENERAAYAR